MFSRRVERIQISKTVDVHNLANQYREQGIELIDFGAADSDLGPPQILQDAVIRAIEGGESQYTDTNGIVELRRAVAEKLRQENGIDASADKVLITPGSKQAIFESMFSLVDDGDEVVIFDPSWTSYAPITHMLGGEVIRVPLDEDAGFAMNGNLEEYVTDETKLIIFNTPHNPTGTVFSKDDIEVIRDLSIDHDCWVLSDEIYEKLVYEGEHHSVASFSGMADRTITVNGFSKTWSISGWRLGFLHCPEALIDQVKKVNSYTVSCAPSIVQRAGIAALNAGPNALDEFKDRLRNRRDLLVSEFAKYGISIEPPAGTFLVFVPTYGDDLQRCKDILEQDHVVTTPGSAFNWPGYMRLSYTTSEANIVEGVRRISNHISPDG